MLVSPHPAEMAPLQQKHRSREHIACLTMGGNPQHLQAYSFDVADDGADALHISTHLAALSPSPVTPRQPLSRPALALSWADPALAAGRTAH